MNVLSKLAVLAAFASATAAPVMAQQTDHATSHPTASTAEATDSNAAASVSAESSMSEGVIRKVDKENQKITIRHGELKNLDMPPMTMVFRVQDPELLETVNAGDEVKFAAEKVEGKFIVNHIEKKN